MEWLTLTEHSIEENLSRLLGGYACPILAKLLFLLLSRLKGEPHIDFLTFSNALLPLMSEYSEIRGEVIFRLLDVDGDGKLSILNILQVHHHLSKNGDGIRCMLAIELRRLYREYMERNIQLRQGFRHQVTMNEGTFHKLVPQACLVDELRLRIFAAPPTIASVTGDYLSPFEPLSEKLFKAVEVLGCEIVRNSYGKDLDAMVEDAGGKNWKPATCELLSEQQYEKLFNDKELAPKATHLLRKLR